MTPPAGLRRLDCERVPCGSGALRDQAKSLAEQRRANREGDYPDGLVAVEAGRCLSREGMQRPLAKTSTLGSGLPTTPSGWQVTYQSRAVPCRTARGGRLCIYKILGTAQAGWLSHG